MTPSLVDWLVLAVFAAIAVVCIVTGRRQPRSFCRPDDADLYVALAEDDASERRAS